MSKKPDEKVTQALRMREAGGVKRCHVIPHVGEYSVGFHTFGMLVLLETLHPQPTLTLYRAILHHDLHERHTGDMPGIVRRIDPGLYRKYENAGALVNEVLGYDKFLDLSPEEEQWLHALDKLELWMWCHDQANCGNDHAINVIDHMQSWFTKNWDKLPFPVQQFFTNFEWRRTEERL